MKMNWNFSRDAIATAVKPSPLRLTYPAQQQNVKDTRKTGNQSSSLFHLQCFIGLF